MNAEHVDAQLMRGHLDSCRRILERMCVELAESPAEAAGHKVELFKLAAGGPARMN